MSADRLIIFDTTLRDGEQSPGASMNKSEKLRIAKALERMKVDIIEAGFAIASDDDFQAIHAIAGEIEQSTVCSLARALDKDIERAAEAIKPAARPRIHTFIATSPIHMKYKLQMAPEQVLEQAKYAVRKARQYTDDVEFSCEDAGRSEIEFLCRIIEAAIQSGAGTINIPDTVGYAIPGSFGHLVGQLIERIPNAHQAVFSVHCHNDLGLAVANSLAAVEAGARQVECTVNGLGERAGNAALEEIVMSIRTRKDHFGLECGLDTTQIVPASRLVSSITGFPVQPNKAIVGANAFAHESGIHQDGILKHRETYEIMKAQDVGWHTNSLVLGKHSGRNAVRSRLKDLGYRMDDSSLEGVFEKFKNLADKKHQIFDEDLHALMNEPIETRSEEGWSLQDLEVTCKVGAIPLARLVLDGPEGSRSGESTGSGPVDATFKAIEQIADSQSNLQLYSVNAITSGTDSQGEVTVRLEKNGRIVNGTGADTDIVIASAKAYLNGLNLLNNANSKQHPQSDV